MKLYLVAAIYALWLLAINVVFYLVHGQEGLAQEASVLAGIVPMALQLLLLGFNPVGMARPARMMLVFLCIVLLSYLANGVGWLGLTYLVLLLYVGFGTLLIAGCPDRRLLVTIAQFYSVPTALWLLYIDHFGAYLWGRLVAGDLQSNVWGLDALSVGVAAFAFRSRVLAAFCLFAASLTMFDASSRSSIVGLMGAAAVVGMRYLAELRNRKLIAAVALIAVGFVVAAAILPTLQQTVVTFANDVFKVDDPLRGFGTGGTGRDVFWRAALLLWWQHPLFGVGYLLHEYYMPLGYEAHNAYIAMLADTGLFGFAWYVGLLAMMWRYMFRIADPRTRYLVIALTVSYSLIDLFERRAVNGANSMSWLFLMGAMVLLRESAIVRLRDAADRTRRRWRPTRLAHAGSGVAS
jgi:O-antigen ligase